MVKEPSKATLKRYGLSLDEWTALGDVCFVCKRLPSSGRLCVDHEHVKGWKKMPPEKRKLYVRGKVCFVCNHYYLGRGITVDKARNVVLYLERYEARRPK